MGSKVSIIKGGLAYKVRVFFFVRGAVIFLKFFLKTYLPKNPNVSQLSACNKRVSNEVWHVMKVSKNL